MFKVEFFNFELGNELQDLLLTHRMMYEIFTMKCLHHPTSVHKSLIVCVSHKEGKYREGLLTMEEEI